MSKFITIVFAAFTALILVCPIDVEALPVDAMLVLDNSGSMRKNDPHFLAKEAVGQFIGGLRADTNAGVIIFDRKIDLAVPLTGIDDQSRARLIGSLNGINYRGQYTDSPAAVERAIYELKNRAREDANKVIIFMTDGLVDTGNAAADLEKTKWLRDDLAADAADNGIKIFAIAFTEKADFFLIQSLAKKTGGEYYRAITADDLAGVFDKIDAKLAGPMSQPEPAAPPPPSEPAVLPVVPETLPVTDESAMPEAPPVTDESAMPEAPPPTDEAAMSEAPPTDEAATPPTVEQAAPSDSVPMTLADLSPEDRKDLEELAKETGVTVEQLFDEIMNAPAGEAVVVHPADEAPPVESISAIVVLLAVAGLILLAIAVVVWFVVRRARARSQPAEPAAVIAKEAIPDAFLKDINNYTDEPSIKLGEKPLMIGRVAGGDTEHIDYYVINQGTVGRRHAVIKYRDFSFWIIDQGSVNGTFVNAKRISGEQQLRDGDRISFHKFEFEFAMPDVEGADHTVFADPSEATVVADMAATMAATAATDLLAQPDKDAIGSAGDLFELSDGAAAPADEGDDLFAMDGGPEAAPVDDGGLFDSDEDSPSQPPDQAGMDGLQEPRSGEMAAASPDENDAAVDEALGVQINLDAVGAEGEAGSVRDTPASDFDAEASAFFDDSTFGPTQDDGAGPDPDDDDMFGIDDAPPALTGGLPASGDQFGQDTAILDAQDTGFPGDDEPGPDLTAFSESETMTLDEAVSGTPPGDPNDTTLEEFLDTELFDTPRTERPVVPPDGDVTLEDFMSTAMLRADDIQSTSDDATALPGEVTGAPAGDDDLFDVTGADQDEPDDKDRIDDEGDETFLPRDVPGRPKASDDDDDSESTTIFNVGDPPK